MTVRASLICLAACGAAAPTAAQPARPAPGTVTLTYLGVAGWKLEADHHVILADPLFSRPANTDDAAPVAPDAAAIDAAIAAHDLAHAELIVVGHSHYDHLLDAPTIALRTGATLMGSASMVHVARASGVADDHLVAVKGGEDLEREGFSIRVIPSLHSETGAQYLLGEIADHPALPLTPSGYAEGGTLAYLVRIAGREILIFDTANFVERELEGIHPDIAIIAPGLREAVHDYTCRLLHVLGDPPIVIATHFDDHRGPPVDAEPDSDLVDFRAEVARCSPGSKLIIPKHFEPMRL